MIKRVIKLLLLLVLFPSYILAKGEYEIIHNKADINFKMSVYPIGGSISSEANVLCVPASIQFIGSSNVGFTLMGGKSVVKGFSFNGEEVHEEIDYLFLEGGISFFINNNYYDSDTSVKIGEKKEMLGKMNHYFTVPAVDRDIFAIRSGFYYSDCSYVITDDYDRKMDKNEQKYIIYGGIAMTNVSKVKIEIIDQQLVKQFGSSKSNFFMETIYLDLLYALDNRLGVRLGANRTINSFMDIQVEAGIKPGEGMYCRAGLGIYVTF